MRTLRPAPDNQPTSSIQFMLDHAENRRHEWDRTRINLQDRLDTAREMSEHWRSEVEVLRYQIHLRDGIIR